MHVHSNSYDDYVAECLVCEIDGFRTREESNEHFSSADHEIAMVIYNLCSHLSKRHELQMTALGAQRREHQNRIGERVMSSANAYHVLPHACCSCTKSFSNKVLPLSHSSHLHISPVGSTQTSHGNTSGQQTPVLLHNMPIKVLTARLAQATST